MNFVVISLVVFVGVVGLSEAFQCFKCDSAVSGQEACATNPFEPDDQAKYREGCSGGKSCLKIVNYDEQVKRSCNGVAECEYDSNEHCEGDVCTTTYCCDGDACNTASRTGGWSLLTAGALLLWLPV